MLLIGVRTLWNLVIQFFVKLAKMGKIAKIEKIIFLKIVKIAKITIFEILLSVKNDRVVFLLSFLCS